MDVFCACGGPKRKGGGEGDLAGAVEVAGLRLEGRQPLGVRRCWGQTPPHLLRGWRGGGRSRGTCTVGRLNEPLGGGDSKGCWLDQTELFGPGLVLS